MEKYLFVFILTILCCGVLFGGFIFFQPIEIARTVDRGMNAKNLSLGYGKINTVSKKEFVIPCRTGFLSDGTWILGNKIGNTLSTNYHAGIFSGRQTDDAFQYNPNSIIETKIIYRLPAMPQTAATPNCLQPSSIEMMKSGTGSFNTLGAGGRDVVAREIRNK